MISVGVKKPRESGSGQLAGGDEKVTQNLSGIWESGLWGLLGNAPQRKKETFETHMEDLSRPYCIDVS